MKITAKIIDDLLEKKHSGDVFVSECKMGSAGSRILDGWAMKKSWANQVYTGYEIKISRHDFLRDEKYQEYLKCCNRFYWVCPSGLIDKSEVGHNCGLIYVTKSGNRLITKKKAPAIAHDNYAVKKLMSYILMYRISDICASTFGGGVSRISNAEYWAAWLNNKNHTHTLGRSVSNELVSRLNNEVLSVKAENSRLSAKNNSLEDIREFLNEIGIDPSNYVGRGVVERVLNGDQRRLIQYLKNIKKESDKLLSILDC